MTNLPLCLPACLPAQFVSRFLSSYLLSFSFPFTLSFLFWYFNLFRHCRFSYLYFTANVNLDVF